MIRICVIDDHVLMTKLLANLIDGTKNMEVLFVAKNGEDFFTKLQNSVRVPDIVIMDLEMPKLNGFDAIKILRRKFPEIKIIVLTMHTDSCYIKSLVENDINGYVSKSDDEQVILKAIDAVAEGETYYNADALRVLSANIKIKNTSRYALGKSGIPLSTRELEVLTLMAEGLTTSEIMQRLNITRSTTNAHKAKILEKTESRSSVEAVIYAFENGIVDVVNKRKF